MILTITIWIITFFVLFSFGDMLIFGYNQVCKREDSYGILDVFILGLCSILIPLQALSLFFPSNQYTLLLFTIVGLIYWIFNKQRFGMYLSKVNDIYSSLSLFQKGLIVIVILLILVSSFLPGIFFDADFYHLQQIKWNEQFAIVPGFANWEDRFGFNSNFLLLSAIFTFSFISGKAYITLQGLVFALIFVWGLINLIRSKYDVKYVLLLFFLCIMHYMHQSMLRSSSTDIIPLLCIFYFIARSALSPRFVMDKALFAIVLLTSLVTYKFSTAFFLIFVGIYVIVEMIREKRYRELIFIGIISFLILSLWFVRNTIITGYLIFPIYQIDIFSFDWKMPWSVLKLEQEHIKAWAERMFRESYSGFNVGNMLNLLFFAMALLLPLILIIRKKALDRAIVFLSASSYIAMILCFINAPDYRFFSGFVFGNSFIVCLIILYNRKIQFPKRGMIFTCVYPLCLFAAIKLTTPMRDISKFIVEPLGNSSNINVEEYKLGHLTVLMTNDSLFRSFYTLPSIPRGGLPFESYMGDKLQDVTTIEPRGESLQDGFRTKEEYRDLFNENVEEYLQVYYKNKYNIDYE